MPLRANARAASSTSPFRAMRLMAVPGQPSRALIGLSLPRRGCARAMIIAPFQMMRMLRLCTQAVSLPLLTTGRLKKVLSEMNFALPRGKDAFMAAVRTSAGVQVPGRSLPNLVPEGLGPSEHLAVGLRVCHPMARPPVIPDFCARAIAAQPTDVNMLIERRLHVDSLLSRLASAVQSDNALIQAGVDTRISAVVRPRNVAFMREISFICGGQDANLFIDYVSGLPMMGWARHSTTMMARISRPPRAFPASDDEVAASNKIALAKARSTGDVKLDAMAWEKTSNEI